MPSTMTDITHESAPSSTPDAGADDAFLHGIESMVLFPGKRPSRPMSDPWAQVWKALGSDWNKVGRDLRVAEERAKAELAE